ncbi:hypothetical protein COLO4_22739 [Corchorus olitorius]|uniref:Uncharacterized protein n=1 Tax=Corchorus olitorius TaxID=93759 RepID=A0A1R3IKB3_9ROSI|nr:hypothetical protein COLO4_22739 [Corchorus olitorius]
MISLFSLKSILAADLATECFAASVTLVCYCLLSLCGDLGKLLLSC